MTRTPIVSLPTHGFDLRLEELLPGGDAVVCLEAQPGACLDCLIPDDALLQILEHGIRLHTSETGKVILVKKGFEGLTAN